MTRLIKIIALTILFFFLLSSFSFGQDQQKDSIEELFKRIEVLEGQKENIDKQVEIASEKVDMKAEKIYWIFGILCFLGASTILGIYRHFSKKVKEIGEEQLEKKFDKFFNAKKQTINEMIGKLDDEIRFRNKKQIMVLTPTGEDNSFMEKFLKSMNFSNYNLKYVDKYTRSRNINLLILNNERDKFNEELMNQYISDMEDAGIVCFYFGPYKKELNFKDGTARGNVRAQLYGNIIDALRYQEKMLVK